MTRATAPLPIPRRPTAHQRLILAALAAGALTTPQLHAQLQPPRSRRALELGLHRLATYGWVQVDRRTPPGSRQPRHYWRLLPAGVAAGGTASPPPAPPHQGRDPRAPTAHQRAVLELLTEFAYLTTAQIGEYLGTHTSRRALQARLTTLRERGWIAEHRLQPERGAASQRAWKLLPAGGVAYGAPDLVPAPLPARQVRSLVLPPPAAPLLHPQGQAILALLAHWKALTTEQITRYLWDQWPTTGTTQAVFAELVARRMIRDRVLTPERGATSPHYWQLRTAGAKAINIPYASQYRKRPPQAMISYRGLLLDLIRGIVAAGWEFLPPHIARPGDPVREDSAQVQHLTRTVLAYLRDELAARAAAGESAQALAEDRAQVQAGQIGAILPRFVNDWVAYRPDDPVRTVLLIPQPPNAGLGFWLNKPAPARHRADPPRRESRLTRYHRLAAMLPVIAVFPTAATAAPYAKILTTGGFEWATVDGIAARLRHR